MSSERIIKIRHLLESALSPTELEIIDNSYKHIGHPGARSGAGHFHVKIASAKLENLSRLAAHRLIYQAVDSMMPDDIHALEIEIL